MRNTKQLSNIADDQAAIEPNIAIRKEADLSFRYSLLEGPSAYQGENGSQVRHNKNSRNFLGGQAKFVRTFWCCSSASAQTVCSW
jgi:hypothetical protein